jgi:hypothetical protein
MVVADTRPDAPEAGLNPKRGAGELAAVLGA